MRSTIAVFAAGLLALAVSSCGSDAATADPSRPLTLDEATQLASVQYDNYQDEGAEFRLNSAFRVSGDTLAMQGVIDWKNHFGYALVMAEGAESGIAEVFWTDTMVLERWPGADELLTSLGYSDVQYFGRAPDPSNRLLDRALAVLVGMASTQRDNAQLIQQKAGSSYLRDDELRDTPVSVLRYGDRNVYWLDAVTRRMMRFEGDAEGGGAPIMVDINVRGPQTIEFPSQDVVLMVDTARDLYDNLLAAARGPEETGR